MSAKTMPPIRNRIAVIAHRGGAGIMPENTLAAFQRAIRLGCDYVEVDVRTTRDGKLVIMHDRTVDRTTNGSGAVNELTLAAVRKLDAGAKFSPLYRGEKVPTLDEVFELCRAKINVYIDHKDAPIEAILHSIRRHRMEKQVLIYGGWEKLKAWKQVAPHLPVMPSLPQQYRKPGGIAELKKELPVDALDGDMDLWTSELVQEAHREGITVYVDNLGRPDTPEGYRQSIEMGVDGIETDYPDELLRFIRR
ncbi:MAG: glycerophosphodiester phosphodiesterase family protein [Armatimonadota bacterium]|nr:glycerophosphodiester phosphodiesterase family protein [Armatimonadota bacterium]